MHCSTLINPFHILLFFLFIIYHTTADPSAIETVKDDGDDVCKKVDCGQGKCVPTSTPFPGIEGFDCVCKSGWNKMQLGPITFPACTVPNCTIDFKCGSGAPPEPPPPPPANPPPISLFNPCSLVWCGDGSCVVNGIGYYCKCNEGSANLFNLTGVACFKQCSIGADCFGVSLGGSPEPPPPSASSGTVNVPNCSRSFGQLNLLLFSLVVLLASI